MPLLAADRQGILLLNRADNIQTELLCVFRVVERKKKAVQRCEEQLMKMEVQATNREENKQIALGTSKLNYLDPRISVAW